MIRRHLAIHLVAFIGILAASYALYVEFKMDEAAAAKKESVAQTAPKISSTGMSDASPFGASPFAPKKKETEYKAMCDFDIKGTGISGSCTKVFGSEYARVLSKWGLVPPGHWLDLSLAQAGIMLYSVKFCYPFLAHLVPYAESLFMSACSASCGFSVYLIYILKVSECMSVDHYSPSYSCPNLDKCMAHSPPHTYT